MRPRKSNSQRKGVRKRISPEISSIMHPTRQAIMDALEEHGRLSTIDLEKQLQESRYNLYHHLNILKQQGLIREGIEGKVKYFELTKKTPVISLSMNELPKEKQALFLTKVNELLELFGIQKIPSKKQYRCIIVEEKPVS